jgi:transposase-like protein
MVKMRHEGRVENRAVYVAIGIDLSGRKDVLGLWTSANPTSAIRGAFQQKPGNFVM